MPSLDIAFYEAAVGGLGDSWATLNNDYPLVSVHKRGQSSIILTRTKNSNGKW